MQVKPPYKFGEAIWRSPFFDVSLRLRISGATRATGAETQAWDLKAFPEKQPWHVLGE